MSVLLIVNLNKYLLKLLLICIYLSSALNDSQSFLPIFRKDLWIRRSFKDHSIWNYSTSSSKQRSFLFAMNIQVLDRFWLWIMFSYIIQRFILLYWRDFDDRNLFKYVKHVIWSSNISYHIHSIIIWSRKLLLSLSND